MTTMTTRTARSRARPLSTTHRTLKLAPRTVLLALDNSRPANAAMRFARRMAQRGDWLPEVVTVTEPVPTYVGDVLLPMPPLSQDMQTNNVLLGLKSQMRRHGTPTWHTSVRFGLTAPAIVDAAQHAEATMIVMGLGQHGRLARLFGAETVGRVARHADVPVLAVHAKTRGLPSVAVVGMDFGESCFQAARESLALLEPPAQLHLVHVAGSYNMTSFEESAWKTAYAEAVELSFARVTTRLAAPEGVEVATTLLTGDVVEQIVAYAKKARADLIAAGSHDQRLLDRMIIGSTPAQLLRESPCAVLIAPPTTRRP